MHRNTTLLEHLQQQGVSRRAFLQFCAVTASTLALPAYQTRAFAAALASAPRPTVIWLSFQECTGCTESLTRSFDPTVESLILEAVSLDYHHTLQVASGAAAEEARRAAMALAADYGGYVLVVDGAVPTGEREAWSTIAGVSNLQMLQEAAAGAALIVSVGSCAAFGGLPAAAPNPSNASGVLALMTAGKIAEKPLINVPGCPPVPEVISAVLAYYLANGAPPELDALHRPVLFYGATVHEACPRKPHFAAGNFALSFDDDGARQGHCLYFLGCQGPTTHNACATVKWNEATSLPMHSGHGCLGCAQPNFWDGGGFYL